MVKRLIGSDTTGTDGSVSIPYTGAGAGLVNLSVETEIDGSIVSEPCNVLDCVRYYNGTLNGTEYDNEFISATERSVTVDSTGTTLTIDSTKYSSTFSQAYFKDGASVLPYQPAPLCIEVTVLETTNVTVCFPIKLKDGTTLWWSKTDVGHFKIVVTEDNAVFYLDDVQQWNAPTGSEPLSATSYLQSLRANGDGVIKFKDYKIYPI